MSFNNELYGVGFEVEKLGGVSCVVRWCTPKQTKGINFLCHIVRIVFQFK